MHQHLRKRFDPNKWQLVLEEYAEPPAGGNATLTSCWQLSDGGFLEVSESEKDDFLRQHRSLHPTLARYTILRDQRGFTISFKVVGFSLGGSGEAYRIEMSGQKLTLVPDHSIGHWWLS